MSSPPTCIERPRVDAHFELLLSPDDEHAMRLHLPKCDDCRARYERRLLLEALDPTAGGADDDARRRIGRGLGVDAARHRRAAPWAAVAGGALAAAVALLIVRPHAPPAFTARGAGDVEPPSRIVVYHAAAGQAPVRAFDAFAASDDLAFAYESESAMSHVMIFGVDEHRHVYWYYPAWTSPTDEPMSIPIAKTKGPHRLPDAVRQPVDGAELVVVGLFTDRPLSVKEVEREVALAPPGPFAPQSTLRAEGAEISALRLAVTR
jgi:hypothetical protein